MAGQNQDDERRRYKRLSVYLPAEARFMEAEEADSGLPCRTENIGAVGLRLKIQGRPKVNLEDLIFIRLDALNDEGHINLQGRVKWIEPQEGDPEGLEVGVQLTGMELKEWDRWLSLLSWHSD